MESYLYNLISEKQLRDALTAFHACTDLPVQLIDSDGSILMFIGELTRFCVEFKKHLDSENSCEVVHAKASLKAMELGETYIFSCQAGLHHIVFPLMYKNKLYGAVSVGPFIMEHPDASMIIDLSKQYDIPVESLLVMSETSYELKEVSPDTANSMSRLLYHLLNSLISDSREQWVFNQGKLLQQSRINESIQMYKTSGYKDEKKYPYDKEKLLISRVTTGDIDGAKSTLNELLGYLFLYENHNVQKIKVRIIELCSLLSRASIERGADAESVLAMNDRLIASLIQSDDLFDLCYRFQDNVEIFTESLFFSSEANSDVVKKTAEYITGHFSETITLAEAASFVHMNPSYLSKLFKNVTGMTFTEYLNKVRLEEAKRLLNHTDYSIIDIAVACGFSNQSYFTKVFKKYTGTTPKQYR